jgi:hypothetical protein
MFESLIKSKIYIKTSCTYKKLGNYFLTENLREWKETVWKRICLRVALEYVMEICKIFIIYYYKNSIFEAEKTKNNNSSGLCPNLSTLLP